MNKGRRHELKMLKYKKRIRDQRLSGTHLFAFRSHGKPCNCWMCRKPILNGAKKREYKELQFQLVA